MLKLNNQVSLDPAQAMQANKVREALVTSQRNRKVHQKLQAKKALHRTRSKR